MKTIIRLTYVSVLFLFICTTTYSADHYVNKNASGQNNGTSWANAWQSFSAINWGSINPGDYIYISGGTDSTVYNETLEPACSGTASNYVTIIAGKYSPSPSGHSGRVIIDGNNHANYGIAFFDVSGSVPSYVKIKGLETRNVSIGAYANFNNSHNCLVLDSLSLFGFYDSGIRFETGETGYQNADSLFIQNCTIISPNYISGESDGIQLKGVSHVFIDHNYIRIPNQDPVQHVDAIQGYLCNGGIITNNVLINDSVYSVEGGGIPIIYGAEGTLPVIIYNNFCYMGGVWYSGGNWAGTLMTRWYDHNPMPPTWIINNTVVSNGPRVRGIWLEYATPTTTTVINNIIAQYSTTSSGVLDNFDNSTGSNLRVDSIRNNLFYHSWESDVGFAGNVTGNGNTGQPTGWSDWVSTYGGTGVKGDPLLVSNIGYEPDQGLLNGELQSGSPAINQGEDVEWLLNYLNTTYGLNGRLVWEDIYGNPRDNSPTIGAYEYTSGGGGGNNPPNQPSNPNPTNGAIDQPVNLVITWSCTDPDGDPLTYDVYFGTSNNPPLASSNQSNASYNPGQLNNSTTYYWKIIAKDNQGASTSGPVWNFITEAAGGGNNPPNQPSNPNPTNGAIDQPVNLVMTWSCTDPDGDPLTYDVYFGTSNNPPLASSNQSNASYNPGQLNNSTTYYWKIIAKDNQGATTTGPVWNFSTEVGGDVIPPELIGVQIVEANKVVLDFSEPLDESQVNNLGNYIISEQLQVLGAELNTTQTRICLTTDVHLIEHIYTIEIHNLMDLAGNVISSQANSAFYKKLDIGAPGYLEHLIEYVDASATTDTNTSPQKTLDGLVNGDPDPNSRWAAEFMPQWIQFDLGEIKDINLIAISFYQWNAGRIYEYSIQISNDENNWNEIVSNASSSTSQEWTFNDFSPILSARYVRIICESNNQANWAGVWEARIFEPDYPTSVETESRTYALKQNYPNPFNPSTIIDYSVPERTFVSLSVFNAVGQEVAILIQEEKEPGEYTITFNATNLPSGIYFYQLKAGNYVETKKMVLIK